MVQIQPRNPHSRQRPVRLHRPSQRADPRLECACWHVLSILSAHLRFADHQRNYDPTAQAKGRVERVNQTLQDRLVKEMRLKGQSPLYTIFHRQARQPEIVASKNVNHSLNKPAPDHPWRNGFATSLSKSRNVTATSTGDIPTLG